MSNLTLPVTLAGLTAVLDVLAPKASSGVAKTSPDNFLSLLNAGGKKDIDAKPAKDDESDNTPIAVDAPAPVVQVKHTPVVHHESDVSDVVARHQDAPAADKTIPQDNNSAPETPQPKTSAAPQDNAQPSEKPVATEGDADVQAPADDVQAPADIVSVAQTAPVEDAAVTDVVRPALSQNIQNIRQVLQVIISAFSALGAITNTQQDAAATLTGPADSPITGPVTTDGQAVATQVRPELDTLQNIVDVLQQMERALNVTDGAQGVVSDTGDSAPDLASLTQQLQTHLDTLSKLLHAAAELSDDNRGGLISILLQQTQVTTVTVSVSATETLSLSPQDLINRLREGIASLRGQLKELQTQNDKQYARAETHMKQQFGDITQLFKDALAAAGMTLTDSSNDNMPAAGANIQAAAQQATATPVVVAAQPQVVAPVAVAVDAVQLASQDSNAHNQSGTNAQQQQQSSAQSIAPAGQSSASAQSSNAQNSAFARALDQQQQMHKPVAEQVTFHIRTAVADGSSKIRIQLDPESLGKLEIKLHVGADGKTGVAIIADNKATLDLLQRDVQGLTRALADAGLSTDSGSLNFNLRGGQQEQGQNAQAAASYQGAQPDEDDDITPNVPTRSYVVNLAEGLDIKI